MERHMNFYFTRHGETEWNVKKKIQGTTDIPLDEKGIQQAKRLAETLLEKQRNGELHLDRVYTSPQLRAAETARFSAEALGIECIRLWDLREMDLGDWEGRNWDEIRETEAERHHIWDTHRRFCHTPGLQPITSSISIIPPNSTKLTLTRNGFTNLLPIIWQTSPNT